MIRSTRILLAAVLTMGMVAAPGMAGPGNGVRSSSKSSVNRNTNVNSNRNVNVNQNKNVNVNQTKNVNVNVHQDVHTRGRYYGGGYYGGGITGEAAAITRWRRQPR